LIRHVTGQPQTADANKKRQEAADVSRPVTQVIRREKPEPARGYAGPNGKDEHSPVASFRGYGDPRATQHQPLVDAYSEPTPTSRCATASEEYYVVYARYRAVMN
jgi:hypothetical protein